MNNKFIRFFLIFLALNFSILSVFSVAEIFSSYNTQIKINSDNTINVSKQIVLQNTQTVGIVPGQIEFKILTINNNFKILNYFAKNKYGQNISSRLIKTKNYTTIMLSIFQPILPGFKYIINLNYKVSYEPSGFIFKKFQIPLKENVQIPIKSGTVEVELPKNVYFTYVDYVDNSTKVEKNKVIWKINDKMPDSTFFEYSYLPLKVGNIQGSILFWIIINIILLIFLIREIRKSVNAREK